MWFDAFTSHFVLYPLTAMHLTLRRLTDWPGGASKGQSRGLARTSSLSDESRIKTRGLDFGEITPDPISLDVHVNASPRTPLLGDDTCLNDEKNKTLIDQVRHLSSVGWGIVFKHIKLSRWTFSLQTPYWGGNSSWTVVESMDTTLRSTFMSLVVWVLTWCGRKISSSRFCECFNRHCPSQFKYSHAGEEGSC